MKEKQVYWLDAERKAQMGARINNEIQRRKTTKSQVATRLNVSRAQMTLACKNGSVSVELLAEIARILNTSLDYLVFGRFPTADPEFQATLQKLLAYIPDAQALEHKKKS